MLRWRVLTALPLGLAVLWVVWAAPPVVLSAVIALMAGVGAWEWSRLGGLQGIAARLAYLALVLVPLALLAALPPPVAWPWLAVGVLWWLGIFLLLLRAARAGGRLHLPPGLRLAAGPPTLILTWLAFVELHALPATGAFWVTLLLLLVWGADIGAYFSGRALGRRKLAPALSPGKTWEGVWGGLALALLAAGALWLAAPALGVGVLPPPGWLLPLAAVTVAASVIGDLFESLLKRQAAVKDSGRLLPGHGGVLDRVDALLAAAPVFAAALQRVL